MGKTSIEWCDYSFNGWLGCQKVGPGCDNCYAETWAKRTGRVDWGPQAERRRTSLSNWTQPIRWDLEARDAGKPARVFCGSLCDWADNRAPPGARSDLWRLIQVTPHLIWMLLTKRVGNISACLPADWGTGYPNVALMLTLVNQEEVDRDLGRFLSIPARWHGLSIEPQLGPIDLRLQIARPDFVINGGESGWRARPSHPDWFRSLRDQCYAAEIPYLLKQWGEWAPGGDVVPWRGATHVWPDGTVMHRLGKQRAGRRLDGELYDEIPVAFGLLPGRAGDVSHETPSGAPLLAAQRDSGSGR